MNIWTATDCSASDPTENHDQTKWIYKSRKNRLATAIWRIFFHFIHTMNGRHWSAALFSTILFVFDVLSFDRTHSQLTHTHECAHASPSAHTLTHSHTNTNRRHLNRHSTHMFILFLIFLSVSVSCCLVLYYEPSQISYRYIRTCLWGDIPISHTVSSPLYVSSIHIVCHCSMSTAPPRLYRSTHSYGAHCTDTQLSSRMGYALTIATDW